MVAGTILQVPNDYMSTWLRRVSPAVVGTFARLVFTLSERRDISQCVGIMRVLGWHMKWFGNRARIFETHLSLPRYRSIGLRSLFKNFYWISCAYRSLSEFCDTEARTSDASQETSLSQWRILALFLGQLLLALSRLDYVAVLVLLLLALSALSLPAHDIAADWKQGSVDDAPGEQDANVLANVRLEVEQDMPAGLDDLMQRPSIAERVERRDDLEGVKRGSDIGNDPEDEPQRRPRLANDHGHVLAGEAQGDHAEEVDHPPDWERSEAVRGRIEGDLDARRGRLPERDLHREGDERVAQGHEEVRYQCRYPPPDDKLPEVQGRVALGLDVFLNIRVWSACRPQRLCPHLRGLNSPCESAGRRRRRRTR